METIAKMSVEGCFKKDRTEVVWIEKVVDNPKKDLATTMETGESLKMVTPTEHFLASTSHAGPSDSMSHAPSIGEIFQSTVEY